MRIVAGELGGRRLLAPRGDAVRPTTDRVRESLFSILGEVSGLDALDLFAGTGALGLEALSRGARAVALVDTDPAPARANADALGVQDRVRIVRSEALAFLRRGAEGGDRYDLVFVDPPYRLARPLGPDLSKLLPNRLREGARVVVESAAGSPVELDPVALPLLDERRYGSTLLRIHGTAEARR